MQIDEEHQPARAQDSRSLQPGLELELGLGLELEPEPEPELAPEGKVGLSASVVEEAVNGPSGESEPGETGGRSSDDDIGTEMADILEPDPALLGGGLQVDEDETAESVYAVSHYPTVGTRFQIEHPYDSTTLNSSSRSLYADELDYVMENGRRYCGNYTFPNDELEQDRLRVVHQVFLNLFKLELTSVPLQNPTYILDIGTGTGEWAISMGEVFPSCEVVGVDISAIQPTAVPHNVFFEIDDCEIDWMRPDDRVDLVHLRDMAGAFADWSFIYRQAIACLKPGGYLEVLDFHDHTGDSRNFYDSFPPESDIHTVARELDEASIRAGRRRGIHHLDPRLLSDAGFVDIDVKEYSIPLSPSDDSVGKLWLIACLHGLEAGSLRPLTKYMGWEPARVFATCERLVEEFKQLALNPDTAQDFKVNLRVVTARKPFPPGYYLAPDVVENGHAVEGGEDDSTIGS